MKDSKQLRADHNRTTMQKTKKELTDALSKNAQEFCGNLRYLMNTLWLKNKDNEDINDLKRRITIATSTNPITIIEIAGPQFYKYRESLSARKVDFFMEKDYVAEIKTVQAEHKVEGDTSSAGEVIDIIKSTFNSFKEAEKTIILNKAIEMLSCYVRYLVTMRELMKFKEANNI